MVTPALDGAPYNLNGSDPSGKMYNWTCGFYDSLSDRFPGQDDQIKLWRQKFHRTCPNGVKNCFWAQAQYATQSNHQTPSAFKRLDWRHYSRNKVPNIWTGFVLSYWQNEIFGFNKRRGESWELYRYSRKHSYREQKREDSLNLSFIIVHLTSKH